MNGVFIGLVQRGLLDQAVVAALHHVLGCRDIERDAGIQSRPQHAEMMISVDPHSPDEFRVNGTVRNIDEFYTAFGVAEGDQLYLPPEERVRIWL